MKVDLLICKLPPTWKPTRGKDAVLAVRDTRPAIHPVYPMLGGLVYARLPSACSSSLAIGEAVLGGSPHAPSIEECVTVLFPQRAIVLVHKSAHAKRDHPLAPNRDSHLTFGRGG